PQRHVRGTARITHCTVFPAAGPMISSSTASGRKARSTGPTFTSCISARAGLIRLPTQKGLNLLPRPAGASTPACLSTPPRWSCYHCSEGKAVVLFFALLDRGRHLLEVSRYQRHRLTSSPVILIELGPLLHDLGWFAI